MLEHDVIILIAGTAWLIPLIRSALELVENEIVTASDLLLCCLKFMSWDEVQTMLELNELDPRFIR